MYLSRTNLAGSLVALALVGCGKIPSMPTFGENEGSFTRSGDAIDLNGQKGVGQREGSDYTKTFTVANKTSVTETIANTQSLQVALVTITETISNREDNWTQPNNHIYLEFALSQVPYQGVIDAVYVNGTLWPSNEYAYKASNNSLYFPGQYARHGTKLRAVYRVSSGPHPTYAFSSSANAVGVSITHPSTGAAIPGSFSGNIVTITGLSAGQQVAVKYYLKDQAIVKGVLQRDPAPGTVKINIAQCVNSPVSVSGRNFSASCVAYDVPTFSVVYEYEDVSLQSFDVPEVTDPDIGEWEVRVNGAVSNVYRRQGNRFFIDQIIPHGAKVEIIRRKY